MSHGRLQVDVSTDHQRDVLRVSDLMNSDLCVISPSHKPRLSRKSVTYVTLSPAFDITGLLMSAQSA